jgi:hypothetical protein
MLYMEDSMEQLTAPQRQSLAAMYAIIGTLLDFPDGAPSGVLYMGVMNRMSHFEYMTLIGLLKDKGWVKETAYLLTWTGPDLRKNPAN